MNAYEEIYEKYAHTVYEYLLRLCNNSTLAEDLLQTTFLKAIEHLDNYKGNSSITTWLCSIGKHEYLNHVKRKENQNVSHEVIQEYAGVSFEEKLLHQESKLQIHKILHNLKEPYKEVFSLRVFGELSFREIGELFDKTDLWARVTYRRAKEKILEKIN